MYVWTSQKPKSTLHTWYLLNQAIINCNVWCVDCSSVYFSAMTTTMSMIHSSWCALNCEPSFCLCTVFFASYNYYHTDIILSPPTGGISFSIPNMWNPLNPFPIWIGVNVCWIKPSPVFDGPDSYITMWSSWSGICFSKSKMSRGQRSTCSHLAN